ncbi:MAG: HAD-IC family P-type ATPase [Desulfarculus sp.]|nr:HAD-IC family P-type ATPase [Desulfarculus sp.]
MPGTDPQEPVWHALSGPEALDSLGGEPRRGLEPQEARRRLDQHGPNQLETPTGPGALRRLLGQFNQPLVYILLASGAVTAFLREWVDAGVILGVVLVNAVVGYVQEAKALQALAALSRTMVAEALVLRGGQQARLDARELVPGDMVLLQAGDKVPADLRLLGGRELRVDESALTGESLPVEKDLNPLPPATALAERRNMAYASTLVTHGQGRGLVVATGARSEVGRISRLMTEVETLQTPLTRKIARFSHLVLWAILALAATAFAVGLGRGQPLVETFMAAVALAVGAIPEGLPAAVTITLAIGVSRMARRRAVVRRLPAVETLGSTTVICTDKTGTLTENRMTVQEVWAGGSFYAVTGTGYEPSGEFLEDGVRVEPRQRPALWGALLAGALCNDSELSEYEQGWRVQGDPTEGALLAAAAKAGFVLSRGQNRLPRLDAIPFASESQFMATMHDAGPGQPRLVYLKGAVETVLARCSRSLGDQCQPGPLRAGEVLARAEEMAGRGLRVLALAQGHLAPDDASLEHEEVAADHDFLGLVGMLDPPRPEAVAAVAACRRAGIRVKMITGDHALTAQAIAQRIGLGEDGAQPPTVLGGQRISALGDEELARAAQATSVFARVSPEQKLRLVRALQARGEIVAMTGDGVNDAPALRQADIGVAMGLAGTEVAKQAADMVLADDNFASIAAAVEEGRGVFDNLVKFIVWTLPTNLGEGLVILAAILAGVALPILPVQILWINMTTAVALGLMLAFEPKEPGIMDRPPRPPARPILTRQVLERLLLVGALLLAGAFGLHEWELALGASQAQARTVAVNVFVLVELFYLFNCRSLTRSVLALGLVSNPPLFAGVGLMLGLQLLFTYWPAMNGMFHSAPVGPSSWLRALGVAVLAFLVVEGEKRWRQARGGGEVGGDRSSQGM